MACQTKHIKDENSKTIVLTYNDCFVLLLCAVP